MAEGGHDVHGILHRPHDAAAGDDDRERDHRERAEAHAHHQQPGGAVGEGGVALRLHGGVSRLLMPGGRVMRASSGEQVVHGLQAGDLLGGGGDASLPQDGAALGGHGRLHPLEELVHLRCELGRLRLDEIHLDL